MRQIILTICGVVSAVGLLGASQQPPQAEAKPGRQHAAAHQSSAVDASAAISNRQGSPNKNSAQDEPSPLQKADLTAQQAMALFAGLQLILTFFGLLYIRWTLIETRTAVNEAKNATDAAQASVDVARESAEKQLRAYVAAHNIRIKDFAVGKHPTIMFDLKNTGQTVAKRVCAKANMFWRFEEIDEQVMFSGFKPATFDMPPGATLPRSFTWPVPLSQAEYDAFERAFPVFFYAGIVTYRDVFNVTRRTIWQQTVAFPYLDEGSGPLVPFGKSKGNRST